jgi:hypothetical protein
MRTGISFTLSDSDRHRLDAIVADCNASQKHVWRARIVLLSADGVGTNAIMAVTGVDRRQRMTPPQLAISTCKFLGAGARRSSKTSANTSINGWTPHG